MTARVIEHLAVIFQVGVITVAFKQGVDFFDDRMVDVEFLAPRLFSGAFWPEAFKIFSI